MKPDDLLPHVPYLRRHARMLAGSSQAGDDYVRMCLESLIAEPSRLAGGDARVLLYKAFHKIWDAVVTRLEQVMNDAAPGGPAEAGPLLRDLATVERRVVLLAHVEGFSRDEIAEVLGASKARIDTALAEAGETPSDVAGREVLIIEDDPMIAEDVAAVARDMGFTIVGPAANEDDAAALFARHAPALILSDVQLDHDGSGIAAAWRILKETNLPVIFVTGYPEAILAGTGAEPAFVLAKPFTREGLRSTIDQVLDIYARPELARRHGHHLLTHLDKIINMEALASLIDHDRTVADVTE
ncbi:MAG: response regulator [Rhizobiales bacterium]|nr:response regulator [Hyphomicrobiales bacterium]